ncbi:MAG: phytoene desaturase family protein [Verrucomicrobiota bacterium]
MNRNSKTSRDCIVIGGGIGGLAAAIRLASEGKKVTIIEKNAHLGGKCDYLVRDGFHFDLGPSVLTLPFLLDELFAAAGRLREDYLAIEPVEPGCSYFFADGTRFDAPGTMDDFQKAIAEAFPSEIDGFRKFREHLQRLWEVSGPAYLFNPLGIKTLQSIPLRKAIRALPDLIPAKMENRLQKFFKDPRLIQLFSRFATYNGSDPKRTPATFNVVAHAELAFGSWRCAGGMYALIRALTKLAKELGVEVMTNTEVDRIDFRPDGSLDGVLTREGSKIKSPFVVCNQDAATAWSGSLLSQSRFSPRKSHRAAKIESSSSGFVFLAALNRKHEELACHNVFFSSDYDREFRDLFGPGQPLQNPTIYVSRPSCKDPSLAPEGKEGWFVLINAPSLQAFEHWDEREYAKAVTSQLVERCGLAEEEIEWIHFHGPRFYHEQYSAWNGSLYGPSSNTMRQGFLRFPNSSRRIDGLAFCGGSAHPGGGIPLVLLSGKFAATACSSYLEG